jgi:putative sterol carrier protein
LVNREEIVKKINNETFSINDIPDFMENAVEIANSSEDVAEEIEGMNKKFQFDLGGTADFWLKIEAGNFSSGRGKIENADCTLILTDENMAKLIAGSLDGTSAYMAGELQIQGSLADAQKFATILEIVHDELEED